MRDAIQKLLVLQEKDQKLRRLQQELARIPLEREEIKNRLTQSRAQYEKDTASLRENEVARKKLELEVESKEQAIQRYKTQQMQTRKNEEFQALGHEIETAENAVSELETRELELMEEADQLKVQAAEAKKVLDEAESSHQDQIDNVDKREKSLVERIQDLQTQRATEVEGVDEEMLELYNRLMKSKKDAVIVPMEHGVCGGCHMKLTQTTVNAVKSGEEIQHCEFCGRILYDSFT
jgi:hypothetical protein